MQETAADIQETLSSLGVPPHLPLSSISQVAPVLLALTDAAALDQLKTIESSTKHRLVLAL